MVLQLTSCKNEFEAEVIKGALADMGIECILQGKHMSQIYGGIGAMSVNVLIDEKDYDKARAFIDSREAVNYQPEDSTETKHHKTIKEIAKDACLNALLFTVIMTVYDIIRGRFDTSNVVELIGNMVFFFIGYILVFGFIEYYKNKK